MIKVEEMTNAEETTTTIDESELATQPRPTVQAEAAPSHRPLRVRTRIRAGGDSEQPGNEHPAYAP